MEELPLMLYGTWDAALLAPIAEINHDLLAALRVGAMGQSSQRGARLLLELREEWAGLDQAGLERLAACPYLLLDAGFTQPARWERLTSAVREAPATSGYFSPAASLTLLRRALVLGWHLARANRLGARLLYGMSAAYAERLSSSRLQELETLIEHGAAAVAPRWEQQPRVWRQLLRAARHGQALQLRAAQLRGLQLLAAACTS